MSVSFVRSAVIACLLFSCVAPSRAQQTSTSAPAAAGVAVTKLPVREVTVFKDGHAFVLRQGKASVANGVVTVTELPNPVLGTFWPFSAEKGATLHSVVARRRTVEGNRPVLNLLEIIRANIGARVRVTEFGDKAPYEATISAVPGSEASIGEEETVLDAAVPERNFSSGPPPLQPGTLVLLKTADGIKAIDISRIQDVTFLSDSQARLPHSTYRNELALHLTGTGKTATVGMMYLQKGLRWIPNYKVTLDGKGSARITLQATLINDLIDLNNVTLNLVIGVPTFAFKETPDPVGLQDTFAQLSRHFQTDSNTANGFSNAIATQLSSYTMGGRTLDSGGRGNSGPEVAGSGSEEDLFVFTVKNVTLAKRQRLVLPITEYSLPYKDVYTLELPPILPRDLRSQYSSSIPGEADLARQLALPKVQHQVRFTNKSDYPLTTAPALILRGDRVIAQGLMTYTAKGAQSDLALTGAVDIPVTRSDKETKRTPNAVRMNDNTFTQVNLTGAISVTNYRGEPAYVEVSRYVYGTITAANEGGVIEALDAQTDLTFGIASGSSRYVVPGDLSRYNGLGKATWKYTIQPKQCLELSYDWQYLLR